MNNLKAVATYPETIAAHIMQKELETAGIASEVFMHQADETSFTSVSSASLMVAEQDFERATIFLNSHTPEPEPLPANRRRRIHCPECNSANITSKAGYWSRFADYMVFDFFAFFIIKKKDKHYCNDCGHRWRIWFGR
ncbi:MAG: hypothetical protein R3F02_04335 [Thiolinea sp.]